MLITPIIRLICVIFLFAFAEYPAVYCGDEGGANRAEASRSASACAACSEGG